MTSLRHNLSGRVEGVRADTQALLLAAARESVLAVGVRRTTLVDVARRAGVSRMTIYRAYPDVQTLVAALMTDELATLIAEVSQRTAREDNGRDRLVASAVGVARAIPENELFRRVVDVDAELLLPYVVARVGTTQRLAIDALREWIAEGQQDGSIRAGDTRTLAHSLLLVIQSWVLSARVDGAPPRGRLLRELGELLDRYLRPDAA